MIQRVTSHPRVTRTGKMQSDGGAAADAASQQAYMNNMAQWQAVMSEYYKSAQMQPGSNGTFPNAYSMWAQQVRSAPGARLPAHWTFQLTRRPVDARRCTARCPISGTRCTPTGWRVRPLQAPPTPRSTSSAQRGRARKRPATARWMQRRRSPR